MPVEKRVRDVELMDIPLARDGELQNAPDRAGLDDGANVSVKSTPARWRKPRTTHLALYRSRVPLERSLRRNTHRPLITLAPGGRGTNCQVWLRWSALNSSRMAATQSGSRRAA